MTITMQVVDGRPVWVDLDSGGNVIKTPLIVPPPSGPGLDYPPGTASLGLVQGMTDGSEVVRPSAAVLGSTGLDDAAIINDSLARCGRTRIVRGMTYQLNSSINYGLGQRLIGAGMGQGAAVLQLQPSAGAIPAVIISNPGAYAQEDTAALRDVMIDIRSANASATCLQAGDILRLRILDVSLLGLAASTQRGAYFVNQVAQTEQAQVRMAIDGCATPVQFDKAGGTASFDRGAFDFDIAQTSANGNGILWTNGALQRGGSLKIRGNFRGGVTNTGVVLGFSGAGASLTYVHCDVSVEGDNTGLAPQTANFAVGSNGIFGCYGSMDFLNAGSAFQASNNNGQVGFIGEINGDPTLQKLTWAGDVTTIAAGFPAGWTGKIVLQKMPFQDHVSLIPELTIAATTVVPAGPVTILTGLAAPFVPQINQFVTVGQEVNGVWTPVVLEITTAGTIVYLGAGFTAAGASGVQGATHYSNSF